MASTLEIIPRLTCKPEQGYGLAWSPFLEGNLLSGSDDAQICLWDIAGGKGAGRMDAKSIYHEHAGVVEVRSSPKVWKNPKLVQGFALKSQQIPIHLVRRSAPTLPLRQALCSLAARR